MGLPEVERRSGQVFDSCTSPRDAAARLVWAIEGPVPAHLGYVAVPSGWGGWTKGFAPELFGAPRGNALFVFALR